MHDIFISYRRDDTDAEAGRVFDRLAGEFGHRHVFIDVDSTPAAVDFTKELERKLSGCDAMVVLLGAQWLTIPDREGGRRLDDPQDFVRQEIATALRRNIRIIPMLVKGARMPNSEDLPTDLQSLAFRQAIRLQHEGFQRTMDSVVAIVNQGRSSAVWPRLRRMGDTFAFELKAKHLWPVISVLLLGLAVWQLRSHLCSESMLDVFKDGRTTYVLVAQRLSNQFITDAQLGRYYYSQLAVYEIRGSDVREATLANEYLPDPPQGAITLTGDSLLAFFNYKVAAGTYNMNGVIYRINPFTNDPATAQPLFTDKNWGWFPMFQNGDLIHFSFDGYKRIRNIDVIGDVTPAQFQGERISWLANHTDGLLPTSWNCALLWKLKHGW